MQNDDVSAVKNHASILAERLKTMGIQIKRTQALELVSELHDQSDWNRLQAKLKKPQTKKSRASKAENQRDVFFIVGSQGSGRTEALKTLFELECAEGCTSPMFISISGDAQIYKGEVDRFVSQRLVVTINYDSKGITDLSYDQCYGYTVERPGVLFNMVSVRKGDRAGVGQAISQLFSRLHGTLPGHLRESVGSILVDGIYEAPEVEQEAIFLSLAEMAESFKKTFRRAVFTTDVPAKAHVRDQIGMTLFNVIHSDLCEVNEDAVGFWPLSESRGPHKWSSQSLADRQVIADVSWWSFRNACIYCDEWGEPGRANGSSRVIPLPGKSFWYKDLRAAVIR